MAPGSTAVRPGEAPSSRRAFAGRVADLFVARMADLEGRVRRELDRPASADGPLGAFVLDLAREAWTSSASLVSDLSAQAGLGGLLARWTAAGPVDELGFDHEATETLRELVRPLARRWLDLREQASAPLPERGGVLVLLNRSAWPLPVEALVLASFLGDGRLGGRRLVALWDEADYPEYPWVGDFLRRTGLVTATEANACALLERGDVVLAFPEGTAARAKTYERRYRLARLDTDGVLAAALETGAHVVPGALLGSEESYPVFGSVAGWPVTAQFPLLGLAGLLPLPLAWRLSLAPAVEHSGAADPSDVVRLGEAVRARMQERLGALLAARRSIVAG